MSTKAPSQPTFIESLRVHPGKPLTLLFKHTSGSRFRNHHLTSAATNNTINDLRFPLPILTRVLLPQPLLIPED